MATEVEVPQVTMPPHDFWVKQLGSLKLVYESVVGKWKVTGVVFGQAVVQVGTTKNAAAYKFYLSLPPVTQDEVQKGLYCH